MPWQLHSVWQVERDRKREGDKSAPLNIITCLQAWCEYIQNGILSLYACYFCSILYGYCVYITFPYKICQDVQYTRYFIWSNKIHVLAWTRSIGCEFFLDSRFDSSATLFHFFTCFIVKMTSWTPLTKCWIQNSILAYMAKIVHAVY